MPTLGEWRYDEGTEAWAVLSGAWSNKMEVDACIQNIEETTSKAGKSEKPLLVKIPAGRSSRAVQCASAAAAIEHLKANDPARKSAKKKAEHCREVADRKKDILEAKQKEAQEAETALAEKKAAFEAAQKTFDETQAHLTDAKEQLATAEKEAEEAEREVAGLSPKA
mmetsp:Transcript_75871/g.143012  ORF Transcript_75871/g.143012 Transcript_75871/m.143012 type:complete len:167 (-) Transcript_75871:122-622(-)